MPSASISLADCISLTDCNVDRLRTRDWGLLHREIDPEVHAQRLTQITQLLPRLPPLEQDVLRLYFFHGKREATIARMLGVSQQTVSNRLHAAYKRIRLMLHHPEVAPQQMAHDLRVHVKNAFTVQVLCDFWETSSQTATAERLGVPIKRVWWHMQAGLRTLRQVSEMQPYAQGIEQLLQHRNIFRPARATVVQRPHGSRDECARYRPQLARLLARSLRRGVRHAHP